MLYEYDHSSTSKGSKDSYVEWKKLVSYAFDYNIWKAYIVWYPTSWIPTEFWFSHHNENGQISPSTPKFFASAIKMIYVTSISILQSRRSSFVFTGNPDGLVNNGSLPITA